MLLIDCPWCGPRDEVEFRYGGQAHIAYPDDPAAIDDAEWGRFLFMRANPKGGSANAGVTRPAAGAGSTSCATRPPTGFWRCIGSARNRAVSAPPSWADESTAPGRSVSLDGERTDGFAGDTLASALLANGVRVVSQA